MKMKNDIHLYIDLLLNADSVIREVTFNGKKHTARKYGITLQPFNTVYKMLLAYKLLDSKRLENAVKQ